MSDLFPRMPVAMLRNTATGRFHPIVFRPAPPPGGHIEAHKPMFRYRSRGHHTDGFATHEEAVEHIRSRTDWRWTEFEIEWDGVDVPAMTHWFASEDGK